MNLCIVTHKLTRSDGQGRVNAEVVSAAAIGGWRVDVIAGDVAAELLALPNVSWHRVVAPAWVPSALLRYQWFARAARRVLLRLPEPDVLQLNGAIVHGARGGVNVANFVHGDWMRSPLHPARGRLGLNSLYQGFFTRLNAAWERRAFARAERVVAVSDQVRESLVRQAGVDPDAVVVITPGVDSQQFRPLMQSEANALRAELGIGPDPLLLLFVGDIRSNRKNLDVVLRALPLVSATVRLAVIGDAARSPYPAMAASLGVADRVHFLGRRVDDLPALMRGADVFTFPSHYDPFALVVTEAMATGLAVVTAVTVGASCLIDHERNGFVLRDANDVDELAGVIRRLDEDRRLAARAGAAARETALKHSWQSMGEKYLRLYEDLIHARVAPHARRVSAAVE